MYQRGSAGRSYVEFDTGDFYENVSKQIVKNRAEFNCILLSAYVG